MDAKESAKTRFHEAAQQFDGTSKLFRQLATYKDEIAELRRKRASYDTISELLKMDGISVSWKTVARFCHATFDSVRSRRRRAVAPKLSVLPPNGGASGDNLRAPLKEHQESVGTWKLRKRGPRIADSKNL
jgi:hypothetical protein